jgi:hypothetical protein
MGWVRQCWKPIVLLLVLSPLLAEGVSGATPLTLLFMPWILFPYATILYGFLVLVIREVAVRRRLGVLGLWCLGIVYGLYNEGLRAETLFFPLDNPLDSFFDYGLVAGVRVPFAVWIGFWHGLFSVVAPVFFVEYLFPRQAIRPWLPRPATWLLAILTVGTAIPYFLFLSESSHTPDTASLIVRLAVMVGSGLVLWFVAGWLPRTPGITAQSGYCGFSWKPFSWGAGLYLFLFVVPEVLAQGGAAWPLFVLYVVAFATASGWAIARRTETSRKEAVVFLLGAVTAQATLSVLFGVLSGNLLWAASGATFTAAFVVSLVRIRRGPAAVTDCPHP